jgi:polysaccharide export outer membrane protein
MNSRTLVRWIRLALLLASVPHLGLAQSEGEKQEYVIGVGDLLSVKFWQRPELDTEARVGSNGKIEMPLIGAISAAGLTVSRLRQDLVNRISLLDIRVSQASIVVREFGSKIVYVTGAVLTPGKLKFETIPNLWQIILEAGGPQSYAQLHDVTIVRGSGPDAGRTLRVDLTSVIERGELASLPPVYPGDNVNVPGAPSAGVEGGGVLPVAATSGNVIHVIGQVAKPGVFELEKDMDVFDAIVRAGGPTELANLKDVRLYFHGQHQAEVALIDMERYLKKPSPHPLKLHQGDAIYVPRKRELPRYFSEGIRIFLASTASFIVVQVIR